MSDIDQLSAEIIKNIFDVLMPLQTTKELNVRAFEFLDSSANKLAQLLRGSTQLPREIINELYTAAKALQNEAPYAKDPALVQQWCSKLYMTFDLILLGESHDDRKPGVPRVR
jgi:hypothetical protein